MKIDLHCHTLKTKTGDYETRNVAKELFAQKINDNNVRIVGITNHNAFDKNQYIELRESVKETCQIWPGIELDVNFRKNIGHILIIYNPDKLEEFISIINSVVKNKKADDVKIELEELIEKFSDKDAIFIAHALGKAQCFTEEMIDVLNKGIKENYRVFSEPSNFKSLSIMLDNGIQAMVGSDIQDWKKYPNCELPELKLDIDNFDKLILLAKKDKVTINTLLNKKEKKYKKIKIKISESKKEDMTLPIYNDINVIFGAKGTGKSAIIEGLKDKYIAEGAKYSYYKAADVDSLIDQQLKFNDNERLNTKINVGDIDIALNMINSWNDISPTLLSDYTDYIKTKNNNKNKSKLKITTLRVRTKNSKKFKKLKEEYKTINNIIKTIQEFKLDKYLNINEQLQYNQLNQKISEKCFKVLKEEYIDYLSVKFTNHTIRTIKTKADLCTTSKSLPDETGFLNFAKNRLYLKSKLTLFNKKINENSEKSTEKIGTLDKGKEVYLAKEYKLYNKKLKEFKYGKNIGDLKEIITLINRIEKNYGKDINEDIDKLKEIIKKLKIKGTDFIGLRKQFENQDGEYYKPSDGEKIMLILHKKIFAEEDVYLLDEPERSLGNTFINNVIVPRIIELAKLGKTVIIATHNANIAVRTLPFISILKYYENGKYKTYIGNPFVNELVNQDEKNDIKIWKEESIKILEGGKEAFYDRRLVYESR